MNMPTLRVARPSDDLAALKAFYCNGLGLDILYKFADHDGFDGVMFGKAGSPYHFEFTRNHKHPSGRAPTKDNLLVFYIPGRKDWRNVVEKMRSPGFAPVQSLNPYWDRCG